MRTAVTGDSEAQFEKVLSHMQVILANRSRQKADDLAATMGGDTLVASLEDVAAGAPYGTVWHMLLGAPLV